MKSNREAKSRAEVLKSYEMLFESPGRLRDADSLYAWVIDKLQPRSGQRLLDVACGEGILVRLAQERGLAGIGLDITYGAARMASQQALGSTIMVGDGEALPFEDQRFDYVTNMGSLEHFNDPILGIREMVRVLRPNGIAAILLPNSYYLADIIWHVWRTGYSVSHGQPIERFATHGEWKDLLEDGGLKVVGSYKYNFRFPRSRDDLRWYTHHPRKILYLSVAPFVPFNLSYSFLYICSRS